MAASGLAEEDGEVILASLPIRRPGQGAQGALLLALASFWLAAGLQGSVGGSPAVIPGLGGSGAYWAAGVGVGLALLAVHCWLPRQTVVLTREALVVTERPWFRGRTWREPLSSYPAIRCHVEQQPHRYGRRNWYVVRLWHADPAKTVELARATNPAALEQRARQCARRLDLPLVWEQHPAIMVGQAGSRGAVQGVRGRIRDEVAAAPGPGRSLSAS